MLFCFSLSSFLIIHVYYCCYLHLYLYLFFQFHILVFPNIFFSLSLFLLLWFLQTTSQSLLKFAIFLCVSDSIFVVGKSTFWITVWSRTSHAVVFTGRIYIYFSCELRQTLPLLVYTWYLDCFRQIQNEFRTSVSKYTAPVGSVFANTSESDNRRGALGCCLSSKSNAVFHRPLGFDEIHYLSEDLFIEDQNRCIYFLSQSICYVMTHF